MGDSGSERQQRSSAAGLRLHPFRGVRYDRTRVSSLGNVTSPPYDVVDPDGVDRLEALDPHNIVRLILPREQLAAPGDEQNPTTAAPHRDDPPPSRYQHAARTLRQWLHEGVLVPDEEPGLYLYEQHHEGQRQRGLIGALDLTAPPEGVVLPHEDVVPETVRDRAELMGSAQANFAPLLLSYQGPASVTDAIDRIAASATPDVETTTRDGVRHRLWRVTDPAEITALTAGLADSQALIADGHHRWASYLRRRQQHRARHGAASSAWDRGLVLLVDTDRYPLRIQAIHRVLHQLPLREALARAAGSCTVQPLDGPLSAALQTLDKVPSDSNAFLLTGDEEYHLLTAPTPTLLRASVRPDRPLRWRGLDATVLHRALLHHLWRVPDDGEHIGYAHDAASAQRQARASGGTAVLLRPVDEQVVRDLAGQGVMMPRKSTSFGPKPATGLVLRDLTLE